MHIFSDAPGKVQDYKPPAEFLSLLEYTAAELTARKDITFLLMAVVNTLRPLETIYSYVLISSLIF